MKKMVALLLALGVILGGAGCGRTQQEPSDATLPQTKEAAAPTVPLEDPVPDLPMYAVVMEPVTETLWAEDGTEVFKCSYPKLQVILDGCEVGTAVTEALQGRLDGLLQDAEAIRTSAQEDYAGQEHWTAYYAQLDYELGRLDQKVMSMFARFEYHSGGTHPSQFTGSVTYDLSDGQELALGDILVEGWSAEEMAQKVCDALAPKAQMLYPDYELVIRDRFAGEMDGSKDWYLTGEGLCFHFSPYDIAAPFAGIVTAQIPYRELEGVLREEFLPQPVTADGSVYVELCDTDPGTVPQIQLDPQGERLLIYPDGAVTDLRVQVGQLTQQGFQPEALVFAAGTIGAGDAICLQTDLEGGTICLTYRSDGQEVSAVVLYDSQAGHVTLK